MPSKGGAVAVSLTLSLLSLVEVVGSSSCYARNEHPYRLFALRTAYDAVYNKEGIKHPLGCSVERLVLVTRHGTRYMTAKEYDGLSDRLNQLRQRVVEMYDAGKSRLCAEDAENLRQWKLAMEDKDVDQLSEQGRRDLFDLGKRMAESFPDQLVAPYSPDRFIMRHTNIWRTEESTENFARALFGEQFDVTRLPDPLPIDPLLHPYDDCPTWLDAQRIGIEQLKRWQQGPEMRAMLRRINRRLGLLDRPLTAANLTVIYDNCSYQKAWKVDEVSPWCAIFTQRDLQLMEYGYDVKEYHNIGPGNPINARLGCPLLKDIVDKFREASEDGGASRPSAVLYFTHDYMLHMLYARMGLTEAGLTETGLNETGLNETGLTEAGLTDSRRPPTFANRTFRTSLITPFAGNLVAVLYRCPHEADRLQVVFYRNERVLRLPLAGCRAGQCPWSAVLAAYRGLVDAADCLDTASFCSLGSPPPESSVPQLRTRRRFAPGVD